MSINKSLYEGVVFQNDKAPLSSQHDKDGVNNSSASSASSASKRRTSDSSGRKRTVAEKTTWTARKTRSVAATAVVAEDDEEKEGGSTDLSQERELETTPSSTLLEEDLVDKPFKYQNYDEGNSIFFKCYYLLSATL